MHVQCPKCINALNGSLTVQVDVSDDLGMMQPRFAVQVKRNTGIPQWTDEQRAATEKALELQNESGGKKASVQLMCGACSYVKAITTMSQFPLIVAMPSGALAG